MMTDWTKEQLEALEREEALKHEALVKDLQNSWESLNSGYLRTNGHPTEDYYEKYRQH